MFKGRIPSALAFANVQRVEPRKPRFKLVRSETLNYGDVFQIPNAGNADIPRLRLRLLSRVTADMRATVCTVSRIKRLETRFDIYLGPYVAVRIG